MEESRGKRKPLKKATSTDPEELSFEKVEQENISDNSGENSRDGLVKRNIGKTKETENFVKRNLSQESSEKNNNNNANNKQSSQEIRYPNTKNVIKHNIPEVQRAQTSVGVYILGVVLLVFAFYAFYALMGSNSSPSHNGNILELAKETFTHLPKGNGFISSTEIAEQIADSFRTQPHNRALSLLIVGSNLGDLKNSIVNFGNSLCGNVVYLEGKDSNTKFTKDLMDYAKNLKKKSVDSFMCPIFLINTVGISRENLDMLEQAFDDSQPIIRNIHDINSDDISARQTVFFLLYEDADANSSKEKLREKVSREWTGRFFQRIRGVIGVKSEADS